MKALAFLCVLGWSHAFAEDRVYFLPPAQFMPDNTLNAYDNPEEARNISEGEFEETLSKIEAFYKPLVKKLYGAELLVVRDWADSTVNAYATRNGSQWEIHMFGGLARRPEITPDGFELVACHEMGHHLGGFPYVQSWAANEGQSDYFATLSCARHLWKDEADKNAVAATKIPLYPKRLCDESLAAQEDRNLCYRLALAGKSLSDLLSNSTAKFETPDRRQVSITNNQHPDGQCRLDTYLAGAVCKVGFDERKVPRNERESARVSCLQSRQDKGFRPRCWFKPII